MGVTLHYRGTLETSSQIDEVVQFAVGRAHKLEWGSRRIQRDGRKGVLLLPHRHCEIVSVVFDVRTLDLVDAETGSVAAFTKTQFADFPTHSAICRFLRDLGSRALRDLEVEDESGHFASGKPESFHDAVAAARAVTDATYLDALKRPGETLQLGPHRFVVPPPERLWRRERFDARAVAEFAGVPDTVREFITTCEHSLREAVESEGMTLDATWESVQSVESLLGAIDGGSGGEQGEAFSNLAAAYLGRTLCEEFGASWSHAADEGLCIVNLGGTGLCANPFDIVAARLEWGPVHGIDKHYSSIGAEISRLQSLLAAR
ncbi:MAG: hypothetical protein HYR85_20960 [Planctomycetes bacterium]|nr:hypothetical protein [Planctomycetota bacterium]